jgi:hypothetical protein
MSPSTSLSDIGWVELTGPEAPGRHRGQIRPDDAAHLEAGSRPEYSQTVNETPENRGWF